MNVLQDDELRPFLDGDVDAFAALMRERVEKMPRRSVVEITFHKLRCELAQKGDIPRDLASESGRWLEERGMWHGVRWWLLEDQE